MISQVNSKYVILIEWLEQVVPAGDRALPYKKDANGWWSQQFHKNLSFIKFKLWTFFLLHDFYNKRHKLVSATLHFQTYYISNRD